MSVSTDSDSDSYMSFSSENGADCAPCIIPDMDVDDDYDTHLISPVTFLIQESPQRGHDTKEQNAEFVFPVPDRGAKLFPDVMARFLRREYPGIMNKLENCHELNRDCSTYCCRSLVSALNIQNPKLRVPVRVICDLCVFPKDKPILVITVVKDNTEFTDACEQYNTYVARGLNDCLRERIADISVLSGILKQNSDFDQKLKEIYDTRVYLPASFVIMTPVKFEIALACFQKSIAKVKSGKYDLQPDACSPTYLNSSELALLVNHIDCLENANIKEGGTLVLMLELTCRMARTGRTLFQLPSDFKTIDTQSLSDDIPLLDTADNACYRYKHNVGVKTLKDGTSEWTFSLHTKVIDIESVITDSVVEELKMDSDTYIEIDWSDVTFKVQNTTFSLRETKKNKVVIFSSTSEQNMYNSKPQKCFEVRITARVTRGVSKNGEIGIHLPLPEGISGLDTAFGCSILIKNDAKSTTTYPVNLLEGYEERCFTTQQHRNTRRVLEIFSEMTENTYRFKADVIYTGQICISGFDMNGKCVLQEKYSVGELNKKGLLGMVSAQEQEISFDEGTALKWPVEGYVTFQTWGPTGDTTREEDIIAPA